MHPLRGSLRWVRGAVASAWAAVDARDLQFFGGLALFAAAPTWRLAAVGAVLALHAALGGALVARLAHHSRADGAE